MKKYAALDDNSKVVNVVLASSLEIAEKTTSSNCILVTTETGPAWIGLSYSGGTFEQPPVPEIEP